MYMYWIHLNTYLVLGLQFSSQVLDTPKHISSPQSIVQQSSTVASYFQSHLLAHPHDNIPPQCSNFLHAFQCNQLLLALAVSLHLHVLCCLFMLIMKHLISLSYHYISTIISKGLLNITLSQPRSQAFPGSSF